MDLHELPGYGIVDSEGAASAQARALVSEKYELTTGYASEYSELTKEFLTEMENLFKDFAAFEPEIPVDDLDTDIDGMQSSVEELGQDIKDRMPKSPITDDDYSSIEIPEETKWTFDV